MGPCESATKRKLLRDAKTGILRSTTLKKGEYFYGKRGDQSNKLNLPDDGVAGGSQMIEAFISLSDIKNPESLYKIRMSICNDTTVNKFQKIGESEIQTGPKILFDVSFIFEYFFEKEQILSVEIIENDRLKISEFRTSVGRIMGSRGACYKTQVTNIQNEEFCEITIDCKNATKSVIDIKFQVSCNFKNLLSSASFLEVYFIINNKNDGKNWRRVYKSAEQSGEKNSDLNFSPVKLMMDDINAADMDKDFLIEFFDSVEGFIGCVQVSVNRLKKNGIMEIHSQIPNTSEYINNKIIGEAKINIQEGKVYKFIDYLKEGMQVNLIVGIDFTCSNGNFEEPNSLHYCRGSSPNYYERAIKTCGSIVAYYDYDQKFPVYGFGGRTPGEFRANHCFNLNFNLDDPNVLGIDGVIDTYRNHLPLIKLDGPTYFAPLIRRVFENVKNDMSMSPKVYYILLILTDGQINDMDATCDALVSCDVFPISVIIIGIGNADFTNMHILDGDEIPLTNTKGVQTKRDLVQFVEYNKFAGDSMKLAEEVLQEIPRQVEEYYSLTNAFPL